MTFIAFFVSNLEASRHFGIFCCKPNN